MQSILDSDVFNSLVKSSVSDANIMEVKALFLPVHMDQRWGLAVFWIEEQTIRFVDGHHFPIPRQLKTRAKKILECIHSITGSIRFQPDKWNYKRFKYPMPDQNTGINQKHGSESCGIVVIMCTKYFTTGSPFTWSYNDYVSSS
jgi:Ulp1 family protease